MILEEMGRVALTNQNHEIVTDAVKLLTSTVGGI